VNIDEAKSDILDSTLDAYTEELRDAGDDTAAVTLAYTHSLQRPWRTALRMLPVPAHWSVLDVGCGLGVLDFELVANLPVQVLGIDIEEGFIGHAESLLQRLSAMGLFVEGAALRFEVGDVHALSFEDRSFDLVFVRELLQFLSDPDQVVGELFRVLRPGAYLCISDMDDQLRITWPPPSPSFESLVAAVAAVQHERGGDRQTGRKLTTYLRSAGFEIASVVVLPEAQHRLVDKDDAERTLVIEQLHAARKRVVSAGTMDAERFDAELATLEAEEPYEEFRMNARIIVLGRRPEVAQAHQGP
jgi:ubiquinone/menaquinone biosynthesis C-methylase UbiE